MEILGGRAVLEQESYVEIVEVERCCQPVYEVDEAALLGRRLVLTSWMLLDELKQCQEEAERLMHYVNTAGIGLERRCGVPVNPVAERLDRVHFSISQLLKLLWRSGLWTEGEVTERAAADGKSYRVLYAPFTDGKPHGQPVPEDCPAWQRELLGLPPGEGGRLTAWVERPSVVRKAA